MNNDNILKFEQQCYFEILVARVIRPNASAIYYI